MGKINLEIKQGETFAKTIGYYAGTEVVKSISSIARGYPTLLSVSGHGLPDGAHPAWIIGTKPWLNSASLDEADMQFVTKVTTDSVSVRIDSTGLAAYAGGGHLAYVPPFDLTTYSARMEVRKSLPSSEILLTLTTADGLTLADGTISIFIGATATAAMTFSDAVYDLEIVAGALTDPNAVVTRLFYGNVTLSKEVTR